MVRSYSAVQCIVLSIMFLSFAICILWMAKHSPFLNQQQMAMRQKAQVKTLNFLIPDFTALLAFQKGGRPLSSEQWQEYENYFKRVSEIFPQVPESYMLTGTSAYYTGQKDKAVAGLNQASMLNPQLFWPYYNLGVILFKNGLLEESMAVLTQALKTDLLTNLKYTLSSHLYSQIFSSMDIKDEARVQYLGQNLAQGYTQASIMLAAACYELKRCAKEPNAEEKRLLNTIILRIF